ncbi:MAG: hypothetical protein EBY29_14940, partial [Planctomycetes bacterium]|nr:hypothetical protein [Planctomycetota bacterium]
MAGNTDENHAMSARETDGRQGFARPSRGHVEHQFWRVGRPTKQPKQLLLVGIQPHVFVFDQIRIFLNDGVT